MDEQFLFTRFDNVFFEKTRLSITALLYREEKATFNRILKLTGGTDGAVYSHLQKLQKEGYIDQKKVLHAGKAITFYNLTRKGKKTFREYLSFMKSMMDPEAEEAAR